MNLKRELPCRLHCLRLGMTCDGTFNEKATQTLKQCVKLLRFGLKCWHRSLLSLLRSFGAKQAKQGFISVAHWPVYEEAKMDVAAEEQENLIIDMMSDTANILKAMKITPKRCMLLYSCSWKWQVYLKVLEKTLTGEAKIGDLMKEFAADKELKPHMKDIAGLVPRIMKSLTKVPSDRKANMLKIKAVDEKTILRVQLAF